MLVCAFNLMERLPAARLYVVGYADRGEPNSSILAHARAEAVRKFLAKEDSYWSRIETWTREVDSGGAKVEIYAVYANN